VRFTKHPGAQCAPWTANRLRTLHLYGGCVLSSLIASFACIGVISTSVAAELRPVFTVADAIETARFQEDRKGRSVFLSPDGSRYVSFVIRGDIKKDGIWLNVYSGGLTSLDSATPRLVSKHFTSGLPATGPVIDSTAGPSALIAPMGNIPVWANNEEVAYLWADDRGHNQVFSLNVMSGKLQQVTHEDLDVVDFTVHPAGSLAYDTKVPYTDKSTENLRDGFSVKSPDITMLLAGIVDGTSLYDLEKCRRVVAIKSNGEYAAKPVPNSQIKCGLSELLLSPRLISPDGSRLIINTRVKEFPKDWDSYRGHFGRLLEDVKQNPASNSAELMSEFAIVDITSGTHHALWHAPAGLSPWSFITWSPDSKHVLVAPTLLPVRETDSSALEGEAMAIVNAETGQYQRVSIDPKIAASIASIEWPVQQQFIVALRDGRSIKFTREKSGRWNQGSPTDSADEKDASPARTQKIRVGINKGLDQPPQLMGTEVQTGRTRVLLDPNPNLLGFALGHVEMTRWVDSAGLPWEGRLYYPAHYVPGVRYPLVIQTHGYAGKNEFSIYGMGGQSFGGVPLGPGWSVFLAQPLASRDIAVLQIAGSEKPSTQEETDISRAKSKAWALADAAKHLVDMGLVDRDKVGIMGHSATGRIIETALTLTDFPYAAAIAADNYELSYTQSMYLGWNVIDGQPAPFGKGLEAWLDTSPAFNVERIRTPLQLELTTGAAKATTLVYPWEMFSRLRYLKKPVEYYVLPDIAHGSHLVQNPRQLLALQNRALDWWLFWLKSEEDPSAEKLPQYQDWRQLRTMHIDDLKRPRPPVRTWESTVSESR
jgi:dipeptidyl aminopeptidase/acylaminoacyl peptidase